MKSRPPSGTDPFGSPRSASLTRRGFLGGSLLAATLLAAACGYQTASNPPGAATTAPSNPTSSPPGPTTAASTPKSTATAVATSAPAAPNGVPAGTPTSVPVAPTPSIGTTAPTATAAVLTPTDANVDPDDATPPQTEGPYFKPDSPERSSLLDSGVVGTKLTLSGKVVSTRGQPIAKALLDFWQADGRGAYDNAGYTLRGHQFSDEAGGYQIVTVIPGLYPGRTRHIHVKVQAPNQPILTTQLYFPNEPRNASDSIFNPKLIVAMQDASDGSKVATFNFVLNVG